MKLVVTNQYHLLQDQIVKRKVVKENQEENVKRRRERVKRNTVKEKQEENGEKKDVNIIFSITIYYMSSLVTDMGNMNLNPSEIQSSNGIKWTITKIPKSENVWNKIKDWNNDAINKVMNSNDGFGDSTYMIILRQMMGDSDDEELSDDANNITTKSYKDWIDAIEKVFFEYKCDFEENYEKLKKRDDDYYKVPKQKALCNRIDKNEIYIPNFNSKNGENLFVKIKKVKGEKLLGILTPEQKRKEDFKQRQKEMDINEEFLFKNVKGIKKRMVDIEGPPYSYNNFEELVGTIHNVAEYYVMRKDKETGEEKEIYKVFRHQKEKVDKLVNSLKKKKAAKKAAKKSSNSKSGGRKTRNKKRKRKRKTRRKRRRK